MDPMLDVSLLKGFDALNDEDKDLIRTKFNYYSQQLLVKKDKGKSINLHPHPRRSMKYGTKRLWSYNCPLFKILYTNADQLNSAKKTELLKRIQIHKPFLIVICEVKPKNGKIAYLLVVWLLL